VAAIEALGSARGRRQEADMDDRDQRIREIAYRLWEQEGYPESHADRHWAAAFAIVEEQDAEGANSNSENIAEAWEGAASSKSTLPPFERSPRSPPPPLTETSERRRSAASR
jgi:hypothetical protein